MELNARIHIEEDSWAANGCHPRPQLLVLLPMLIALISWFAVADNASAALGDIDQFRLPSGNQPIAITPGPDGALWFTESTGIKGGVAIGRITPAGNVTEFPGVEPSFSAQAIVAGSDENLWFTEEDAIGRITPSGSTSTFPAPDNFNPSAITAGPDGNLWFTDSGGSSGIGRITPRGQITIFSGPGDGYLPRELAAGPDGNIWLTESGGGKAARVGRITPTGELTEFPVEHEAAGIALGPEGNMWFTERPGGIGRITPDGHVTELAQLGRESTAGQIVAGPEGNMWFTAHFGSHPGLAAIERVNPQGRVTSLSREMWGVALSVATGADDNIWFTLGSAGYPSEGGGRIIGRIEALHSPGTVEIPGDRATAQRRSVRLGITCQGSGWNTDCIGQLRLSVSAHLIARCTYKLSVGETRVLRLRLTSSAIRILAKHARLRVNASAATFDLLATTSQSIVLRRRGRPWLPR